MNFGFLLFCFGAGYTYLLSEKIDARSGNFLWSGYIGLFLLFVFATVFYLKELVRITPKKLNVPGIARHLACIAVLFLHVHSGVLTETAFLHAQLGMDVR
jgi:hypothetical protein